MSKIEEEYCKIYDRVHFEIYNAFISLYYLEAFKELNPIDKTFSFKNEFIIFIAHKLQETICSQIYKLVLDGTDNNRKSLEFFMNFVSEKALCQIDNFDIKKFMDDNTKKLITRYRHNYINHIQTDDNLQDIKIQYLKNILLNVANKFNKLYISEFAIIDDRFTNNYLMNLKEKCRIAVTECFKNN